MLQTGRGPASIQYRNPNFSSSFPTASNISLGEYTAQYKELDATIELKANLIERIKDSKDKYAADLVALELQSKTIDLKRRIAADFHGEGTGVVAEVQSVSEGNINSTGRLKVTLPSESTAKGHIGNCEVGDILLGKQEDSSARAPTGGSSFYGYQVVSINRADKELTLQVIDSSEDNVTSYTASNLADGDLLYRIEQPSIPDLSTTVSDYGTCSEVITGIESLVNDDGRTVNSISMEGATGASVVDAGGATIDADLVEQVLSLAKTNAGRSRYSYKQLLMAPETQSALINAREVDRRFTTVEDNKRGSKGWGYVHENDTLMATVSEFCNMYRVWAIPERKSADNAVFKLYFKDFKPVGDPLQLKPSSSGGHERRYVSYLEGAGALICEHPRAVARLENFVTS